MYNEIITHYGKNPPNKRGIKNPTIRYREENGLCGDTLEVFLKIEKDTIAERGFEGNTSIISTACASVFWESILDKNIHKILDLDISYIISLIETEVSPRRKNASVLGLLATRNAIHEYLQDDKIDDFSNVIPE